MKKIIFTLAVIVVIASCKEQVSKGPMILSGKIKNSNWDSITIVDPLNRVISKIKISKINSFIDTLTVSEGTYFLCHDIQRISLSLKSKYDLHLEFNAHNLEETLVFKGDGANENNFLARKQLYEKDISGLSNFYFDEERFLKLNDSLYNLRVEFLNNNKKTLETKFVTQELKTFEIEKLLGVSRYEKMHQDETDNKSFKVSSLFPNPYTSLDFNDDQLAMSPEYLMLIDNYLKSEVASKLKIGDSLDWSIGVLNIVEDKIKSLKVKEFICYPHLEELFVNSREPDSVYNRLLTIILDKELLQDLNLIYRNSSSKIHSGNACPDFRFLDINNQPVTLNSLKGKVLFIDVWATWCSPCMAEIPHLKKLKEDLRDYNIQFVSISKDRNKQLWRKTVIEKKMPGIQILADNDTCSFFKKLSIIGIPRFIILDKNGLILEQQAMRPSDPRLKDELLKYIR
jgi:thiol-disulfide isomerase/thioredoxin